MSKSTAAKRVDPFKIKKTKTPVTTANDTVTPPPEVARAIDAFRDAQDQYKHFEGEMMIFKDQIISFSAQEYAERLMNGQNKSFKILGEETSVTYVIMDASAGLTEEDVAEFSQRWGEDLAEELIVRDFGSIKFEPAVLEANYDAVVEALQVLPDEVLTHLFKPMAMKARTGAAETIKKRVKTAADAQDILRAIKMKNYIR